MSELKRRLLISEEEIVYPTPEWAFYGEYLPYGNETIIINNGEYISSTRYETVTTSLLTANKFIVRQTFDWGGGLHLYISFPYTMQHPRFAFGLSEASIDPDNEYGYFDSLTVISGADVNLQNTNSGLYPSWTNNSMEKAFVVQIQQIALQNEASVIDTTWRYGNRSDGFNEYHVYLHFSIV